MLPITYKHGNYETRQLLFKHFPMSYISYHRDEIMAQSIIDNMKTVSGDMLAIVGVAHLEGIRYWLLKNNYVPVGTYTLAEFADI